MILFVNYNAITSLFEDIFSLSKEKQDVKNEKMKQKNMLEEQKYMSRKTFEKWCRDDEMKNPDDWRILPYGWSPFGNLM